VADFIWAKKSDITKSRFEKLYGDSKLQLTKKLQVFWLNNTYYATKKGKDSITVLGCCYYPGKRIKESLMRILKTFDESMIQDLKKKLVGQFIAIIKKKNLIYIFGDFWHTKNVFYSKNKDIISSSLSVIEENLGTDSKRLDIFKVIEFIAMRHIVYPGWLGNKTIHKDIKRLRPFEYIVINTTKSTTRIGKLRFYIDNTKENNLNKIASELRSNLRSIIENPEFKDKKVGITLTGGYDTRLITPIAINYYKKALFRLAISKKSQSSLKDLKIAKKIARITATPLEVFSSNMGEKIKKRFSFLTECVCPVKNSVITPIIENTDLYSLGFGGCFGTELFRPLPYSKVEDFIEESISKAKKHIKADKKVWGQLSHSISKEFKEIKRHYMLSKPNPTDEIRIFSLLSTGFFASFMLSAYNIKGLQLEPYANISILEIALKVPQQHKGKHTNDWNANLVQKMTMLKIDKQIGKIMTTHFQPMLPHTTKSHLSYLLGKSRRKLISLTSRITKKKSQCKEIRIDKIYYLSDGWDRLFLQRLKKKYSITITKK